MNGHRLIRDVVIAVALVVAAAAAVLLWAATVAVAAEGGLIAIASSVPNGLTSVCYVLVGALIEIRRPGQLVGRMMILAGPLYGLLALAWTGSSLVQPLLDPWAGAVIDWAGAAASWAGIALIAGWIPLLFPTGTLPGPRWRVPAALIAVLGTAGVVATMSRPGPMFEGGVVENPFGVARWPEALEILVAALPILLVVLLVLALAGLVARFRTGSGTERLQVRWLLAGMAIVAAGFAGNLLEGALRTDDGYFVTAVLLSIGIFLIPVTIGIAILRYRLYDIDRVVSRTLSYAVLTVLLAAAFVATNLALQALLVDAVGGGSTVSTAAATLLVAGLFQPARRRVQAAIDRRFNRRRADGERVTHAFARRLRDQVDLERLRVAVVDAADDAVGPNGAGVWLRRAG